MDRLFFVLNIEFNVWLDSIKFDIRFYNRWLYVKLFLLVFPGGSFIEPPIFIYTKRRCSLTELRELEIFSDYV